ncbi:diguanylate cyclase [Clostridium sp. LBM24168]
MVMSLLEKYSQLKKEYEDYQEMAEDTMQKQSKKIIELDKKLDMMSLIVEISQYVNKYLEDGEIVSTVNDIMIGILGVTYSSIYLVENRKLKLKVSNLKNTKHHQSVYKFNQGNVTKPKINLTNSKSNIYLGKENLEIHSAIFIPIYLQDDLLGAIVVEHNIYNYLNMDHIKLLIAVSNQIAMCIENNRLYNQIKENSQRDFLTGLFNRNYFFSVISDEIKNCESSFAIVMIDIDNFKNCNDTFGHQYGDKVLRLVSSIIKDNLRNEDIVARYGGEEIIVYMYDVKKEEDVYRRMCSIKSKIMDTPINYGEISSHVTVSMGISVSKADNNDIESLIREADVNLYRAKNSGKNKVVI